MEKRLSIGIFAHVDAGKTTLAENILYRMGVLRRMGRVDHKDTYFDNNHIEMERGITIFSVSAAFKLNDLEITLLDTPGHVDFSAEAERVLPVLDAVILVISATDGVQSHTRTLWQLFLKYGVPVFVFVNKMDMPGADKALVMKKLKKEFGDRVADVTAEDFYEEASLCDERILEEYLETGTIEDAVIARLIAYRRLFPVLFGSALKDRGVDELLDTLYRFAPLPDYPEAFAGRVYKITRDKDGNRLTHLKVTGGSLKAKELIATGPDKGFTEKIDQIRVYSGGSFVTVTEAPAGTVCALLGPEHTFAGEGLGAEEAAVTPQLVPVLRYECRPAPGIDPHVMYKNLLELSEEEPELSVSWNEALKSIECKVMGEIQLEVLKRIIEERFGVTADFGKGCVVYKETIKNTVEGVGHYEPLRHYSEVHLLMEPLPRGEGLVIDTACRTEVLDKNWQRLVVTHLFEKEHRGVLIGAPITDMRITLVGGRAHEKHTEGGDFREATYRAVRQGLMQAQSVLLEPYYAFELTVPAEKLGRAMNDIGLMNGVIENTETTDGVAVLTGRAPVAAIGHYATELAAYTAGTGQIALRPSGYGECHNAEEVIAASGYDPDADLANPSYSVFCAHGAGFPVEWDRVKDYMHVETGVLKQRPLRLTNTAALAPAKKSMAAGAALDKELEEIFRRTYGEEKKRRKPGAEGEIFRKPEKEYVYKENKKKGADRTQYLLVDGYNIIFAWEDLKDLADASIDAARDMLADILSNYRGVTEREIILVFDAYRLAGHREEVLRHANIDVVYTKEAETADQYIEKTAHELQKKGTVTVATSDAIEQVIIFGAGAVRMSAPELREEVERAGTQIAQTLRTLQKGRNTPFADVEKLLAGDGAHAEDGKKA